MTDASRRTALAERLDAARKRQHLSIRQAAKVADVPPATLQGWLSGRHLPTPALRPHYERLVEALGLTGELELDWGRVDAAIGNLGEGMPYVGLRPYTAAEAPLFFGRDEAIAEVARAIADRAPQHGIVAVIGASGSGKSSLLAAGILGREVHSGSLRGRVGALARVATLDNVPDQANLIVIDQFEDVLGGLSTEGGDSLDQATRSRGQFRDSIATVVALAERATVILGIRADAYGPLSEIPELGDALSHPVLLRRLSTTDVRAVIERPAAAAGREVEPALTELILADVGGAAGAPIPLTVLPLLSNALMVTWGAAPGRHLTVADYTATGGLATAVEALAEGVFHRLDAAGQTLTRGLFLGLVDPAGDLIVRSRRRLDELDAATRAVVNQFVRARILTVSTNDVSISHDALLRHWPRLADWISESLAELKVRQRLHQATTLWVDNDRSEDSLLPVERLPLFTTLVDQPELQALLPQDQREFLDASKRHFASQLDRERATSRSLRRRGQTAVALAGLAGLLALVTWLAFIGARDVSLAAQSRQLAAESIRVGGHDPNLQAQLALVGNQITSTLEGRSALLNATASDVPTRWLGDGTAVLAVSQDQSLVARGDSTGVDLWRHDRLTRPAERSIPTDEPVTGLAFTTVDRRTILAIAGAATVGLWDVTEAPTRLGAITDASSPLVSLAASKDGQIAVGTDAGMLTVYSLADPARPRSITSVELPAPATCAAFDPTAPRLFVGGQDDALWVVHLKQPKVIDRWPHTSGRGFRSLSVAVSPDGRWLAAGLSSVTVVRWDLTQTQPVALERVVSDNWSNAVAFTADSRTVAVGDRDQRVHLIDPATLRLLSTLSSPAQITGVGFVDGAPVATGGDGTLWAWPAQRRTLRLPSGTVYQLIPDPTGHWLAAPSPADQTITVCSLNPRVQQALVLTPPRGVRLSSSVAFDSSGTLYAGTRNGEVVSWRLHATGADQPRVQAIFQRVADISNVTFNADATVLVTPDYDSELTIVSRVSADGTLSRLATLKTPHSQVATFRPGGHLLQVGTSEGVLLFDLSDPAAPKALATIATASLPSVSWWAPTSPLLVIGEESGRVSIWDVTTPASPIEVRHFTDAHSGIYAVSFSGDEKTLVAGGGDEVFWGWDLNQNSTTASFVIDPQAGRTTELRFLPAIGGFAGATSDGAVKLWGVDVSAAQDEFCGRRGDPLTDLEWARYLPGVTPFDPCASPRR